MLPPRTLGRIAGLLYLVVAAGGLFAISVNNGIAEAGDPAATADNIRASATLYRLSFVSNLVAGTFWLLTAMSLYLLLRHVHQLVAAAMVIFVAVGAAGGLNLLNQYTALNVATGDAYAGTFGRGSADTLAMMFVDMERNGSGISGIYFGLWLLPLGYLIIRSRYFPKTLGVLLIVGCVSYLAALFTRFLAPDAGAVADLLYLVGGLPEFVLIAWLLAIGARVPASATSAGALPTSPPCEPTDTRAETAPVE